MSSSNSLNDFTPWKPTSFRISQIECVMHLPSWMILRLKQCIINLLVNAIQASPEGEKVVVSTSVRDGLVNVDITDRGKGIPPEKEEEVFVPFFTTKSDGTGLGLPIARKIAEAHGGSLQVLKAPVKGATFRVSLPVRS